MTAGFPPVAVEKGGGGPRAAVAGASRSSDAIATRMRRWRSGRAASATAKWSAALSKRVRGRLRSARARASSFGKTAHLIRRTTGETKREPR
jgi:hypothetical protein